MNTPKRSTTLGRVVPIFFVLFLWGPFPGALPAARGQILPRAGDKVRVDAPGRGLSQAVGVLRGIDDETLVIAFDEPTGEVTLRTDEINQLEVSFFKGSHAGKGGVAGFLVGAGAGLVVGLGEEDSKCHPNEWFCVEVSKEAKMITDLLLGTSIGAGLGFLVGSVMKTDRWLPASFGGGQISLSPIVPGGRAGFWASITF